MTEEPRAMRQSEQSDPTLHVHRLHGSGQDTSHLYRPFLNRRQLRSYLKSRLFLFSGLPQYFRGFIEPILFSVALGLPQSVRMLRALSADLDFRDTGIGAFIDALRREYVLVNALVQITDGRSSGAYTRLCYDWHSRIETAILCMSSERRLRNALHGVQIGVELGQTPLVDMEVVLQLVRQGAVSLDEFNSITATYLSGSKPACIAEVLHDKGFAFSSGDVDSALRALESPKPQSTLDHAFTIGLPDTVFPGRRDEERRELDDQILRKTQLVNEDEDRNSSPAAEIRTATDSAAERIIGSADVPLKEIPDGDDPDVLKSSRLSHLEHNAEDSDTDTAPAIEEADAYVITAGEKKYRLRKAQTRELSIIPQHSLRFDERRFLTFLRESMSLSEEEKGKVIENLGELSQTQVDQLLKVLEEEQAKFVALDETHLDQVNALRAKMNTEGQDMINRMLRRLYTAYSVHVNISDGKKR